MIGGHLTDRRRLEHRAGHCRCRARSPNPVTTPAFFPLMKHREWERAAAVVRNLPELRSRVRQLEAEHKAAELKPGK